MKLISIASLIAFAVLMLYSVSTLPNKGSHDAPMHRSESYANSPVAGTYYIENAYKDAKTPNMVTVVLADYRSFDTLGEVLVVFAASMACCFILRRRRND